MRLVACALLLAALDLGLANPLGAFTERDDGQNTAIAAARREQRMAQLLAARDDSSGGYAPTEVDCPTDVTWIRSALTGLSTGEQSFLSKRQAVTSAAIQKQVAAANLTQPPRMPILGMALSGGGYRAMINGLGGVLGLMNTSTVPETGVAGWFDGITYLAGLSGGSWATGTFFANGGGNPYDLIANVWDLESNLVYPSDDKISFYLDLVANVRPKSNEGFPTQITDYWSLALGEHLLPSQYRMDKTPNLTFSEIATVVPSLANGQLPMPIIVAAEREAGETVIAENSTVWEFTPTEFGSWTLGSDNKHPGAFTDLRYLGSSLNNGAPNGTCYTGYDRLSYVMGTSSTLFNGALTNLNSTSDDGVLKTAIEGVLGAIGDAYNDVARYPNFLANWNASNNPLAGNEYITLVDGGETNQNIPLDPLLVSPRQVDAIVAIDTSADTEYSWPNGTAMITTFQKAAQYANQTGVTLRMPEVPSANGFVNGGLNTRPVFFGCNDTDKPIIVYVPNYPWRSGSNTSTYQLEYNQISAQQNMLNGASAINLNGTVGNWPTCFACAMTDRAFGYTASNRSQACAECFNTWCWDGQDNTTTPASYEPAVGKAPSFLADKQTNAPATGGSVPGQGSATSAARRRVVLGWW